jgi:hypothetical protein
VKKKESGLRNLIRSLVENRYYNIIINLLVMVSLVYLITEKFVSLRSHAEFMLAVADLVIMSLFMFDFLLRYYAGRWSYFISDYGWIDFLAALPVLAPLLSGVRLLKFLSTAKFIKFVRILRLFRVLRALKVVKSSRHFSGLRSKLLMPLSTAVMLVLVFGGGVVITVYNLIGENDRYEVERGIIRSVANSPLEEKREILKDIPEVLGILTEEEFLASGYSENRVLLTKRTVDYWNSNYKFVFDRSEFLKAQNLAEGIFYLFVIISTAFIVVAIDRVLKSLVIKRLSRINNKLGEKTGFTSTDHEDEFAALEEKVDRFIGN